ncbi:hypothetical protein CDO87_03500 [Sagittula sp. P11]|uniref:DUF932 domain-containing protein n=1 Tax=Sagittula sp. P11 TaxID=2009329 RepID=UPI000C2D0075|nr:DUF932 domain-containing protein [Sagittula sp. P11]AUC52309.1 hypothetical protein CDO87_03500 [Sagittula sp. P11]
MQRYMNGMSNGGAITARGFEPLSEDVLRAAVPSIFAEDAHESRSDRYAYVPTINVVRGLRREGFDVFSAQQALTRTEGREGHTKHMLRMRHRGLMNAQGQAFEIIMVNSHDGSSAYQMIPGFFRFVCANGLMVGDTFEDVKVRHTGDAVGEVIEGAYRVLEDAPALTDQVRRFQGVQTTEQERAAFAAAAHTLRFPDAETPEAAPITPDALLRPRRVDDRAADLFTTLNVVQENVIRGGQRGMTRTASGQRRRQKVREVKGIDQSRALNRALWTLTERFAELKAA